MNRMGWLVLAAFSFVSVARASDRPGGVTHTAANSAKGNYELLLTPAFTISPGGAYLASEFRYQPSEELGLGVGYGAGEVGFNFGAHAVWYAVPDLESQPAFAILGGLYFNRLADRNYFLVRLTPLVSKTFAADFGKITPYAGMQFTPTFRLDQAENNFSMKASTGVEFNISALSGVKIWSEFGFGIVNSFHEVVVGLSYPFAGIGV